MGCVESSSSTATAANVVSFNRKSAAAVKGCVLFLGAGDSGKTTLRKQIEEIHEHRLRKSEVRQTFASIIVANILDGTLQVLNRMEGSRYKSFFKQIQAEARGEESFISPIVADVILELYFEDSPFRDTVITKANEVQLHDCYEHFCLKLKEYPAFCGKTWVPTVEDCIRSRARTTGVCQCDIVIRKNRLRFIDVGGQRAERRKWLNSMTTEIGVAIFVSALSEYNQGLFEDRKKNRLDESLDLFSECVNSDWMKHVPLILFLNKRDLFEKKYLHDKIPINVSGRFPDAPEGNEDIQGAIDWIISRFMSKRKATSFPMPVFIVTATEAESVKPAFDKCLDILVQKYLENLVTKTQHAIPHSSVVSSAAIDEVE